jgi:hypothetical protein
MTENFDWSHNQSKPPAAETLDGDKNSTHSKVKNFLEEETNDDNDIIIREELKSVQKSVALLKQDIRKILHEELIKFLNYKQQQ